MPLTNNQAVKIYFIFLVVISIPIISVTTLSNNYSNCLYRAGDNCTSLRQCMIDDSPREQTAILGGIITILHIVIFGSGITCIEVKNCLKRRRELLSQGS